MRAGACSDGFERQRVRLAVRALHPQATPPGRAWASAKGAPATRQGISVRGRGSTITHREGEPDTFPRVRRCGANVLPLSKRLRRGWGARPPWLAPAWPWYRRVSPKRANWPIGWVFRRRLGAATPPGVPGGVTSTLGRGSGMDSSGELASARLVAASTGVLPPDTGPFGMRGCRANGAPATPRGVGARGRGSIGPLSDGWSRRVRPAAAPTSVLRFMDATTGASTLAVYSAV